MAYQASRTQGLVSRNGAAVMHESTDVRTLGTTIQASGTHVTIKGNPYSKYNHFVQQYNHPANRVGNSYFLEVPYFFAMDLHRCRLVLAFILCCIPYVCMLMILIGALRLICFLLVIKRVLRNRRLVRNPFQNMVYMPGNYSDVNEYFDVQNIHQITQLSVHGVSTEYISAAQARLQSRVQLGQVQKVMVFTDEFARYEKTVLTRMMLRIIISLIFILLSAYVLDRSLNGSYI